MCIEFRGKRKDNGEWVYGYLYITHNGEYEISNYDAKYNIERMTHIVIPKTVGQYTGLTDMYGNKIFEGDVVKCTDEINDFEFMAVVLFGNPNAQYNWGFQLKQISGEKANTNILLWVEMEETGAFIEVIGNIFDNPELLKGGEVK